MVTQKRSALAMSMLVGGVISLMVHVFDRVDAAYLRHLAEPGGLLSAYLAFFVAGMAHGGFASEWADHLSVFGFNFVVYSLVAFAFVKFIRSIRRDRSSK